MAKFYAAVNERNFSNTWDVLVFESRKLRDEFVDSIDGTISRDFARIDARKIKKNQISFYYEPIKPFSGKCYAIVPSARAFWIEKYDKYNPFGVVEILNSSDHEAKLRVY